MIVSHADLGFLARCSWQEHGQWSSDDAVKFLLDKNFVQPSFAPTKDSRRTSRFYKLTDAGRRFLETGKTDEQ